MAITEEQIMRAADELDQEGQNPTLARVRKKLGGGSFTTISEVMIEWRAQKARSVHAQEPPPQAVTDRLSAFGDDIWALALEIADAGFAGEREAMEKSQQEKEEARLEATALADQLTDELAKTRTHILTLEETLSAARKETIAVATERNEALRETAELREQLASVRGELQAVTLCHQEIITAIKQKTTPVQ
ncbi:DNA-binding protein [Salmonella enterica subsp. diarizonae]|uniref:DNA-binding protein n=1 Tax=Salmonella enterica TaxID=28901 RepID=UPI001CF31CAD|nr:DNA-binding protein [Salmonella enterica subsp. diarizonae]